jgi:type IV pilus assembly protein PilA
MHTLYRGFTWIELVMILAVIGILAAMAFPAMQDQALKKQVKEALALSVLAKAGVQAVWAIEGEMPNNNKKAGIPEPEKIIGSFVSAVHVHDGAVTLTLGNQASKQLQGKKVTLRPAVVADQKVVPISWLCHAFPAPQGMEVHGKDETDVQPQWLPVECRGGVAPK